MQNADFNPDDFQNTQQSKMDEGLLVKFFIKPKKDDRASQSEGRPVFKDVEYIDIKVPGDRLGGVCRPAQSYDIARFPRHYEAFKARNTEELIEGTPLAEWPQMSRSMVEELAFYNVRTVEQLIAMPDSNTSQFMGMNTLKAKAKVWLEQADKDKVANELQSELDKRDADIAELKAQVADLMKKKPAVRKKRARKKATAKKE